MIDFTARSEEDELMDDLQCSGDDVYQTLRELEYINKWLGGNNVTLGAIRTVFNNKPRDIVYRVADLGCGSGDMLRHIHRFGEDNNFKFLLTGIDANPNIISYARKNLQDVPAIGFEALDIFSQDFKEKEFDVIVGTLFFHHFSNEKLTDFFRSLRGQISTAIVINDIHRHPLAYHSIRLLTSAFSKSSMVKFDAPLSVRRAFRKAELLKIIQDAGYKNFTIRWKWAFRWQVVLFPS